MTEIKIVKVCPKCENPNEPGNFGYKPIRNAPIHLPGFLNVCNNCGHRFSFFKEVPLEREDDIIGVTRTGR